MVASATSDIAVLSAPAPLAENPYQHLLYRALGRRGIDLLPDPPTLAALRRHRGPGRVLHVHWLWLKTGRLRRLAREARFRRRLAEARTLGWKVVWTAHNVHPHGGGAAESRLRRALVRSCDGIIAHTEASREELRSAWSPTCAVEVIPHGHYRDAYPAPPTREDARARLGLDGRPVVLFFGRVQRYKGVDALVSAVRRSDLDATLMVCGDPRDPGLGRELERRAGDDPRIRLDLRFVPPGEAPLMFAAADVVALPFRKVTTSGSAILALSFDRPVMIPDQPSLREVCGDAAEVFRGDDDLVPALERVLTRDPEALRSSARAACARLEWDSIAEATDAFLRRVVRGDRE